MKLVSACAVLLVHLLGAGGIEMPAITQTLLLLIAAASLPATQSDATAKYRDRRRGTI